LFVPPDLELARVRDLATLGHTRDLCNRTGPEPVRAGSCPHQPCPPGGR